MSAGYFSPLAFWLGGGGAGVSVTPLPLGSGYPSNALLRHTATIMRDSGISKTPGGARITDYADVVAENVPCRVHVKGAEEISRAGKIDMLSRVKVYFDYDYGIDEHCRISWADHNGNPRFILVDSFRDMAGMGRIFVAEGKIIGGP